MLPLHYVYFDEYDKVIYFATQLVDYFFSFNLNYTILSYMNYNITIYAQC